MSINPNDYNYGWRCLSICTPNPLLILVRTSFAKNLALTYCHTDVNIKFFAYALPKKASHMRCSYPSSLTLRPFDVCKSYRVYQSG